MAGLSGDATGIVNADVMIQFVQQRGLLKLLLTAVHGDLLLQPVVGACGNADEC